MIAFYIAIFIICILLICLWRKRNQRTKIAKLTRYIKNPLVITIAIGEYDKDPKDSELGDLLFSDLTAIDNDIKNLVNLFEYSLNYTMSPKYDIINIDINTYWTRKEIIKLLKQKAKELSHCVEYKVFDGLIVVISCHGIRGHIVTSDYKMINKDTIHRIFTVDFPSLRHIPGIFIYDCCDGDNDMVRDHGRSTSKKAIAIGFPSMLEPDWSKSNQKSVSVVGNGHIVLDAYGSGKNMWYKGEVNPDFNLVIINSSNTGFMSQMGSKSGSYMIRKFTEKVKNNIDNGNKLFLNEILHDIQEELHQTDKQLVEAKYNNKLEYIKFKKNNLKNHNKNMSIEMDSYVALNDV